MESYNEKILQTHVSSIRSMLDLLYLSVALQWLVNIQLLTWLHGGLVIDKHYLMLEFAVQFKKETW